MGLDSLRVAWNNHCKFSAIDEAASANCTNVVDAGSLDSVNTLDDTVTTSPHAFDRSVIYPGEGTKYHKIFRYCCESLLRKKMTTEYDICSM
jgi:hypothetical protein